MNWTAIYRGAVVALLAVIILQQGGAAWVAEVARDALRAVQSIGKAEEMPAPAAAGGPVGGIDAAYQADIDRTLQGMVDRAASAPGQAK